MRIGQYTTVFATAIDRALDEDVITNGQFCLIGYGQRLNKLKVCVFITLPIWLPCISAAIHIITSRAIMFLINVFVRHYTLACTKHMSPVIGWQRLAVLTVDDLTLAIQMKHLHVVGTDFNIVLDGDRTLTSAD